jgi:hypothetical protein
MIESVCGIKFWNSGEANVDANTRGRLEVLYRVGKAVHPGEIFAARELLITLLRLRQQLFLRLQRDDRVDGRVYVLNVAQIGLHHLDTRELPRLNRARQRDPIKGDDFIHSLGHKCFGSQDGTRHIVPRVALLQKCGELPGKIVCRAAQASWRSGPYKPK